MDGWNANEFTLSFEHYTLEGRTSAINVILQIDNGSNLGSRGLKFWDWDGSDSRLLNCYDINGNKKVTLYASQSIGFPSQNVFAKVAITFKDGNLRYYVAGNLASEYTGGDIAIPESAFLRLFGYRANETGFKDVTIIPKALTEDECLALTSGGV